jgi:hypothetical protein
MTKSKVATLFVVVMVLVFPALGGAAGQTTVTSVYTVGGQAVSGVDTGLVLTDGMSVTATATGAVCASGDSSCPGPNGDASYDTTGGWLGGFVLPGAPAWGLVGRVGNGPWVQVGSGPTTLSGTGTLVFSVNDDYFWDNGGSFTVTVTVSTVTLSSACFPGWGRGDTKHPHVGPPGRIDSCYPGHGYGDTNHSHSGPPGLIDKPNGGSKGGGGSVSNSSGPHAPGDPPSPPSVSNGSGPHPPGEPSSPPSHGKQKR